MSTKRGNNGKWYTSFRFTDPKTGKRRQHKKEGFDTKREAEAYQQEYLQRLTATGGERLSAIIDEYLADLQHHAKQTTIDTRTRCYNTHIRPQFGDYYIGSITANDIRKWRNRLIDSGKYKPSTIKGYNRHFAALMRYAATYHGIANPFAQAGPLRLPAKIKNKDLLFWTADEFHNFIAQIKDPLLHLACDILFYTGMRRGELCALRWCDIDLTAGVVHITRNRVRTSKGTQITTTKTVHSTRDVTIPRKVTAEIIAWRKQQYHPSAKSLLIPITPNQLSRYFRREQRELGIEHKITLHGLRHSHASLLIQLGYSVQAIADRLGHSSPQQVIETYGHLYPEKREEIADRLNDV